MKLIVTKNYEEMSKVGANYIVELVNKKPTCVLGLATGSTPEGMYKELINSNKGKKVDFKDVISFNLDEYIGLDGNHDQSYRYFMNNKLFNHINIDKAKTHVPSGVAKDIDAEGKNYDAMIEKMGGIDLQILGIGNNGHIGFNEPDNFLYMGTHITDLKKETIEANSRFFASIDEVPTKAITMGVGNIMKAKQIILLASGKGKADVISKIVNGKITTDIPASVLQMHNNVIVIVDEEAASKIDKNHVNPGVNIIEA